MSTPRTADRRRFLKRAAVTTGLGALGAAGLAPAAVAAGSAPNLATPGLPVPETGMYLSLLGTSGGPVPFTGRSGISTAVVVDGHSYVVDMGHGSFEQFAASGLDVTRLEALLVTHLHSDHLADLFTLPWLRFGGVTPLTKPVTIYGPGSAGRLPRSRHGRRPLIAPKRATPGIKDFVRLNMEAAAYDLNLRMRDEGWPNPRKMMQVHEIKVPDVGAGPRGPMAPHMKPFPVFSDSRVTVTAILVDHPPVYPSFAYRFESAYGTAVISGDTTVCDNVVTLARGADVLAHEVIDLQVVAAAGDSLSPSQVAHLSQAHTDVLKVGGVAQRAGVPLLVLTHLSPGSPLVPDATWAAKAQRGYTGVVVVGTDQKLVPVGVTKQTQGG